RTAEWLARGERRLAGALAGALLLLLVRDHVTAATGYGERLVLPFEHAMEFLGGTTETLRHERRPGETVVAPLAFVPYLMLELGVRDAATVVPAGAPTTRPPDWIVYLAEAGAEDVLPRLTSEGGYAI